MPEETIKIPCPAKIERIDGFYTLTYGPEVLSRNPDMAKSLGMTIAYLAEAERILESILKSIAYGNRIVINALLANFRGHKKLIQTIQLCLNETQQLENAETFTKIAPHISKVWELRDNLAHGIWANCDQFPDAAIRISARAQGRMEEKAKELFLIGDYEAAFNTYKDFDAEIWKNEDFQEACLAAEGVVNSLITFSVCIGRSPEEASSQHTLLRNQGLLRTPPWNSPYPTQPSETDDKH